MQLRNMTFFNILVSVLLHVVLLLSLYRICFLCCRDDVVIKIEADVCPKKCQYLAFFMEDTVWVRP